MRTVLAAVVCIGLAAVAGAVIVGTRVFDGTVVEHPYERGIAWDRERERLAASGLEVDLVERSFRTGENLVTLRILHRGKPLPEKAVPIEMTRPATTAHDRTFTARRGLDGLFRALVDLPLEGRWDLFVVVDRGNGPFRFRREAYAVKAEKQGSRLPCDLDLGPCVAGLGEAAADLAFDISPKPVKTMAPLEFTVALPAGFAAVREITVDLTMPGMYMGENTVRLRPSGEGLWKGEGTIVRCPSGRKAWRAEITVPGRGTAAFVFEVDR